jgi:hypothetical protein
LVERLPQAAAKVALQADSVDQVAAAAVALAAEVVVVHDLLPPTAYSLANSRVISTSGASSQIDNDHPD